ncbi:hypothetical protein A3D03_02295 [Candidatus Gottesmanbacteria bacterium RIFCSPHIGHO2_02_FULL_40_13]|uniref:Histidine biosynthesis bifunctional protein HisIE n=1 Tax=Candidatus Gottesmanbacteria bacterium RIFCSPHIGHO2_02_FULL_40_13 TaxID=1798384 RepID=A0A1F6A6Q1_9BACT|nr:MAG: hypothetical protein A3D03_02295 [Candidatus Gottesmanbacteria bacterium RIFCSPHIGHO2_02_FULL_40_13]
MTKLDFKDKDSLIPVIIQELTTGDILMLGFMNKNAWQITLKTGFVYFWSRKRKRLWLKGEISGNKLIVKKIFVDCDNDSLLIKVKLLGKSVCHTGTKSCFQLLKI